MKFESVYSEITAKGGNNFNVSKLGEFSKCVNSSNTLIPKGDYDLFLNRFNKTALCFNFLKDLSLGGDIYYNSRSQKGSLRFTINICDIIGIQNCTSQDIIESNRSSKTLKLRYFFNNYFVDVNTFNIFP